MDRLSVYLEKVFYYQNPLVDRVDKKNRLIGLFTGAVHPQDQGGDSTTYTIKPSDVETFFVYVVAADKGLFNDLVPLIDHEKEALTPSQKLRFLALLIKQGGDKEKIEALSQEVAAQIIRDKDDKLLASLLEMEAGWQGVQKVVTKDSCTWVFDQLDKYAEKKWWLPSHLKTVPKNFDSLDLSVQVRLALFLQKRGVHPYQNQLAGSLLTHCQVLEEDATFRVAMQLSVNWRNYANQGGNLTLRQKLFIIRHTQKEVGTIANTLFKEIETSYFSPVELEAIRGIATSVKGSFRRSVTLPDTLSAFRELIEHYYRDPLSLQGLEKDIEEDRLKAKWRAFLNTNHPVVFEALVNALLVNKERSPFITYHRLVQLLCMEERVSPRNPLAVEALKKRYAEKGWDTLIDTIIAHKDLNFAHKTALLKNIEKSNLFTEKQVQKLTKHLVANSKNETDVLQLIQSEKAAQAWVDELTRDAKKKMDCFPFLTSHKNKILPHFKDALANKIKYELNNTEDNLVFCIRLVRLVSDLDVPNLPLERLTTCFLEDKNMPSTPFIANEWVAIYGKVSDATTKNSLVKKLVKSLDSHLQPNVVTRVNDCLTLIQTLYALNKRYAELGFQRLTAPGKVAAWKDEYKNHLNQLPPSLRQIYSTQRTESIPNAFKDHKKAIAQLLIDRVAVSKEQFEAITKLFDKAPVDHTNVLNNMLVVEALMIALDVGADDVVSDPTFLKDSLVLMQRFVARNANALSKLEVPEQARNKQTNKIKEAERKVNAAVEKFEKARQQKVAEEELFELLTLLINKEDSQVASLGLSDILEEIKEIDLKIASLKKEIYEAPKLGTSDNQVISNFLETVQRGFDRKKEELKVSKEKKSNLESEKKKLDLQSLIYRYKNTSFVEQNLQELEKNIQQQEEELRTLELKKQMKQQLEPLKRLATCNADDVTRLLIDQAKQITNAWTIDDEYKDELAAVQANLNVIPENKDYNKFESNQKKLLEAISNFETKLSVYEKNHPTLEKEIKNLNKNREIQEAKQTLDYISGQLENDLTQAKPQFSQADKVKHLELRIIQHKLVKELTQIQGESLYKTAQKELEKAEKELVEAMKGSPENVDDIREKAACMMSGSGAQCRRRATVPGLDFSKFSRFCQAFYTRKFNPTLIQHLIFYSDSLSQSDQTQIQEVVHNRELETLLNIVFKGCGVYEKSIRCLMEDTSFANHEGISTKFVQDSLRDGYILNQEATTTLLKPGQQKDEKIITFLKKSGLSEKDYKKFTFILDQMIDNFYYEQYTRLPNSGEISKRSNVSFPNKFLVVKNNTLSYCLFHTNTWVHPDRDDDLTGYSGAVLEIPIKINPQDKLVDNIDYAKIRSTSLPFREPPKNFVEERLLMELPVDSLPREMCLDYKLGIRKEVLMELKEEPSIEALQKLYTCQNFEEVEKTWTLLELAEKVEGFLLENFTLLYKYPGLQKYVPSASHKKIAPDELVFNYLNNIKDEELKDASGLLTYFPEVIEKDKSLNSSAKWVALSSELGPVPKKVEDQFIDALLQDKSSLVQAVESLKYITSLSRENITKIEESLKKQLEQTPIESLDSYLLQVFTISKSGFKIEEYLTKLNIFFKATLFNENQLALIDQYSPGWSEAYHTSRSDHLSKVNLNGQSVDLLQPVVVDLKVHPEMAYSWAVAFQEAVLALNESSDLVLSFDNLLQNYLSIIDKVKTDHQDVFRQMVGAAFKEWILRKNTDTQIIASGYASIFFKGASELLVSFLDSWFLVQDKFSEPSMKRLKEALLEIEEVPKNYQTMVSEVVIYNKPLTSFVKSLVYDPKFENSRATKKDYARDGIIFNGKLCRDSEDFKDVDSKWLSIIHQAMNSYGTRKLQTDVNHVQDVISKRYLTIKENEGYMGCLAVYEVAKDEGGMPSQDKKYYRHYIQIPFNPREKELDKAIDYENIIECCDTVLPQDNWATIALPKNAQVTNI